VKNERKGFGTGPLLEPPFASSSGKRNMLGGYKEKNNEGPTSLEKKRKGDGWG